MLLYKEVFKEVNESVSFETIDELNQNAWEIRRSDIKLSWKFANTAEHVSTIKLFDKGLAESLRTVSYCLWRFGNYSASLEKAMSAVKLFRKLNDRKGEADTLNIIGGILFIFHGDNESRLKFNQMCLQLRIEINDTEGIAGSENHIGETFLDKGDFEEADKWFNKCLNNPNTTDVFRSWANHNLGIIHFKKKEFEKAISAFNKSLEISNLIKYDLLAIASHLEIAKSLIALNSVSNEIDFHLNIALHLSIKSGIKEKRNEIYSVSSEIEEKRGNIASAFKWFKKYNNSHNELFNEMNNRIINNIQIQHEIDAMRKEAEFEHLKHIELQKLVEQINAQNNEISKKNIEITDSIKYASRIQYASMTSLDYIKQHSPFDFFVFYQPKDIVSGDFYWALKKDDRFYFAICDSTGHGVPGAFVSLLNISYLHEAIIEKNIVEPNHIFDYVRTQLTENLSHGEQKDGMDGTLICVEYLTSKITYASSYNAPVIIRKNKIIKLPACKMPIGKGVSEEPFKCYNLDYVKEDTFYLFTDGFADQFGGSRGKKLMKKHLYNLISETAEIPIDRQSEKLKHFFDSWVGTFEQVDDITIAGFKMN